MQEYINAIAHRLQVGLFTIPSLFAWLYAVALVLVLAVISLPIGFKLGFLQLQILQGSWLRILVIVARAFPIPGISEELFFRVILLPHPTENASLEAKLLWGCISLAMFIVYHPLEGLSIFPAAFTTFTNPVFLLLAAFLGIACTLSYLQSGSIWTVAAIHWLVVVVWLVLLGGDRKLSRE